MKFVFLLFGDFVLGDDVDVEGFLIFGEVEFDKVNIESVEF